MGFTEPNMTCMMRTGVELQPNKLRSTLDAVIRIRIRPLGLVSSIYIFVCSHFAMCLPEVLVTAVLTFPASCRGFVLTSFPMYGWHNGGLSMLKFPALLRERNVVCLGKVRFVCISELRRARDFFA